MEPYQNSLNLHTISTLEFQYKSTFLSLSSFEKKKYERSVSSLMKRVKFYQFHLYYIHDSVAITKLNKNEENPTRFIIHR